MGYSQNSLNPRSDKGRKALLRLKKNTVKELKIIRVDYKPIK